MKKITKQEADLAYREGTPLMSDQEYDKQFGSNASDIDTPLEDSAWEKFKHLSPMSSLSKVHGIDETKKWLGKHVETVITWKYDGLAIACYYEQGILKTAATRGDGETGEDITRNVLRMKNIRPKLPEPFTGVIKGEIIMTKSDYARYLSETTDKRPYKNTRNGAAGAAKSHDGRNCHYLSVRYYELIDYQDENRFTFEVHMQSTLSQWFRDTDYCLTRGIGGIQYQFDCFEKERPSLDFDVDGIVVALNDIEAQNKLGRDPQNMPKWKIALKFSHLTAETTVEDIEWSVGKQGAITPVAIIEAVDLGVTVRRVSLANAGRVKELRVKKGSRVIVSRRGDVIPYLEENLDRAISDNIEIPEFCPVCSIITVMDGPTLYCSNDDCEARLIGDIEKWIEVLKAHFKIKTIGPERIDEMYKLQLIRSVPDLYTLTPVDLIGKMSKVGAASAGNMLEFQLYKTIPLDVFLAALNIKGLGQGIWQMIMNAGYDTLDKILAMTGQEEISGIGLERFDFIIGGLKKKEGIMAALFDLGIKIGVGEKKDNKTGILNGKSFCITGTLSRGRQETQTIIAENGGVVKSGVTKALDYLIVGEDAGSKATKAEQLGVKIITEKDLFNMLSE